MPIEIENTNNQKVCKFSGGLTIWEAAELWRQIGPLLDSTESLVIDMAEVKECDAAGVQILCRLGSVVQSSEQRQILVEGLSEAVQAAAQLAGFNAFSSFNLPEEV